MLIRITDKAKPHLTKEETFLKNQYNVISRSGLNVTEKQLIEGLKEIGQPKKILFLENRTGVSGIIVNNLYPDAEITIHCLDLYYANKIKKNLSDNNISSITVLCKPYIEQRDEFDLIFLQLSKGGTVKELILDLLQQSHQALQKDGKCIISIEENDPWINDQIKYFFGNYSTNITKKRLSYLVAQKNLKLKRVRNYESEFEMTLFKKEPVRLITIPGVFSHRRVDQGAQALADIVETEEGDSVLDMGCGCGAIGISIAKNQKLSRICLIDSNSRAIYVTEKNCQLNGIDNYETALSDKGTDEKDAFTLFTGNPPYFSNYKISELFIQTAYNSLKKDGRAYIVAKTATYHFVSMKELFGNAELIKRRGYEIIKSVK